MAATMKDPRAFFTQGTSTQFEFVLGLYDEAIKLKSEQRVTKKAEEFIKLDRWYQKELPKKIKSRGKEAHLTHEELCMCMKWKLARGKFSPRLKDLIQMNTPRLCIAETKKAFRALLKKDDISSAIQALCNLKGVGPAMASAILTAGCPDLCGFMADECLMAIPEIEGIDYTTKELLNFVKQLKTAAGRLNKGESEPTWSPHKVEMALWTFFVLSEMKRELLAEMPPATPPPNNINATTTTTPTENGGSETSEQNENGASVPEESNDSIDSVATLKDDLNTNGTSDQEDSRASILSNCEDTNDSVAVSESPSEPVSEGLSEDGTTTESKPQVDEVQQTTSNNEESTTNNDLPKETPNIDKPKEVTTSDEAPQSNDKNEKLQETTTNNHKENTTNNDLVDDATTTTGTTTKTKDHPRDTTLSEEPAPKKLKIDE